VSCPSQSSVQVGIDEQFHSNDCRLESIIGASGVWGAICGNPDLGRSRYDQLGFVSPSSDLSSS
jgi:hypothetical protein